MVVEVMEAVGIPAEFLTSDATAAGLRKCLEKGNNSVFILPDEYRSTLNSMKVGQVIRKKYDIKVQL